MKTNDIIRYALYAAGAYLVWVYVIQPMMGSGTGTTAVTTAATAPAQVTTQVPAPVTATITPALVQATSSAPVTVPDRHTIIPVPTPTPVIGPFATMTNGGTGTGMWGVGTLKRS